MPKPKPVLGTDDLLLLLTHHWGRDTSVFPTEDQQLRFATAMLISLFTGCRPAELVDASKRKTNQQSRQDAKNAKITEVTDEIDDDGAENTKRVYDSDDPDYNRQDPWNDSNNTEYLEDCSDPNTGQTRCKALCYEDVRLWIVQSLTPGGRDVLGMEITLSHHKGADRKPKPYVSCLRILSYTNIGSLGPRMSVEKMISLFFVLSATC